MGAVKHLAFPFQLDAVGVGPFSVSALLKANSRMVRPVSSILVDDVSVDVRVEHCYFFLMTRDEAVAQQLTIYTPDKPCKRGHFQRYTAGGHCCVCNSERSKSWCSDNKERRAKVVRAYYEANVEAAREATRKWQKNNPDRVRLKARMRKRRLREATPRALPQSIRAEIYKIYAECPEGMEVDHVVPLQGVLVCGLHVPWNLQYLAPGPNKAKDNLFDPERWPEQATLA